MTQRVLATLVLVLALLAPWPFGSVEPFFFGAASALVLTVAAVAAAVAVIVGSGPARDARGFTLAVLAVPGVALLGVLPLPRTLVSLISPATVATMQSAAPPAVHDWIPLSLHPQATIDAAVVAGAFAAVVLLIATCAGRGASRQLAWTFVCGGVALALFGLVQRVTQPDPQVLFWSIELNERGTPFGPYVNRNHFGGAMLLFVGVAAGLARASHLRADRRATIVSLTALGVLLLALVATTSRGAILGLSVLTGLALLYVIPKRARWRAVLGLTGLAVLAAVALFALGLLGDLAARIELQPRWLNRFLVQRDAFEVFTHFPLAGTGAGTFPTVFHVFQTVPDDRHFNDAHSDWAQFLMETGVLGAAVGIGLATLLVRRVRTAARSVAADAASGAGPALAIGCLCGLAGLVVHGFFETNLHIPGNALLAAAVTGLAWCAADSSTSA